VRVEKSNGMLHPEKSKRIECEWPGYKNGEATGDVVYPADGVFNSNDHYNIKYYEGDDTMAQHCCLQMQRQGKKRNVYLKCPFSQKFVTEFQAEKLLEYVRFSHVSFPCFFFFHSPLIVRMIVDENTGMHVFKLDGLPDVKVFY
jgi:hypothetical protein